MSEKKFENELATMIAQREMIEEKFKRIMATASCSKVGIKKFEVMDVNRGVSMNENFINALIKPTQDRN